MIYTNLFASLCLLRTLAIEEIHTEYSIPYEVLKILLPECLDFSIISNLDSRLTKNSIKQIILTRVESSCTDATTLRLK